MTADYLFTDCGSTWLCQPQNVPATEHLKKNVQDEAQWLGSALAVEPRYLDDFVTRLQGNGFTCGLRVKGKDWKVELPLKMQPKNGEA